jgi:hypothetical protein
MRQTTFYYTLMYRGVGNAKDVNMKASICNPFGVSHEIHFETTPTDGAAIEGNSFIH